MTEQVETIIVGGGQAGLAVGYYLAQRHRSFVILDANERTGDSWRKRWDSLQLFTPAYLSGLAGSGVSRAAEPLPDQGRDGRLPRGVRRPI